MTNLNAKATKQLLQKYPLVQHLVTVPSWTALRNLLQEVHPDLRVLEVAVAKDSRVHQTPSPAEGLFDHLEKLDHFILPPGRTPSVCTSPNVTTRISGGCSVHVHDDVPPYSERGLQSQTTDPAPHGPTPALADRDHIPVVGRHHPAKPPSAIGYHVQGSLSTSGRRPGDRGP